MNTVQVGQFHRQQVCQKLDLGWLTGGALPAVGPPSPGLRLVGLGAPCGRGLRLGGAAGAQRLVALHAGPLQQPADLAMDPTKVI